MALAACGGSGGGVATSAPPPAAPAPTPTPSPSPTPTLSPTPSPTPSPVTTVPFIENTLQTNGRFQSSAVQAEIDLVASTQIVQQAAANRSALTIDYDAATGSYDLTFDGAQVSFGEAERQPENVPGVFEYYRQGNSGGGQFLTIYALPFISASFASDLTYNKYVAQGYLQTNQSDSLNNQYTRFMSFVFGLETDPGDVPTTGAAHWLVDIFGALAIENEEIRTVYGSGDFAVDFAAGSYQLDSYVNETQFLTPGGLAGSLEFVSGGRLRADGSFGGIFAYDGSVSLQGSLEGAFYGPGAAEVGATFEASNANAYLTGALTGQRSSFGSTSAGIKNISLTNPLAESERLFWRNSEHHAARSFRPAWLLQRLYQSWQGWDCSAGTRWYGVGQFRQWRTTCSR